MFESGKTTATFVPLQQTDVVWGTQKGETHVLLPRPGFGSGYVQSLQPEPPSSENPAFDRATLDRELPQPPKTWRRGWRFSLSCGLACTVFTLLCNIALLILSNTHDASISSDCDEIRLGDTLAHLGINILSTVLLAASNYALQVLMAPTRHDIDVNHASQKCVQIAAHSLANWSFMDFRRRFFFLILVLSGLPLHLLYNSAVVSTTSSILHRAVIVSTDFLEHDPLASPWNHNVSQTETDFVLSDFPSLPNDFVMLNFSKALINELWHDANEGLLNNLSLVECHDTISSLYTSIYSDIILFTTRQSSFSQNSTLLYGNYLTSSRNVSREWELGCLNNEEVCELDGLKDGNNTNSILGYDTVIIESCSARRGRQRHCSIQLIPIVLAVVVACNLLECVVLANMLLSKSMSEPILTLGDAISSFLEDPDQYTCGQGGLSASNTRSTSVMGAVKSPDPDRASRGWLAPSRRYYSGVPTFQWILSLQLYLSFLFLGMGAIFFGSAVLIDLSQQWRMGLGTVFNGLFFELQGSGEGYNALIANAVVANMPQLALSFVYMMYNGIFTIMSVSAEWTSYVHKIKKGLRVSSPAGQQRSTYWLSLPYKISVPLLIASGVSHWLLSQSIFVASISFVNADGQDLNERADGVARLPLALAMFLGVQAVMLLALMIFSFFRFPTGTTIVSTNSWAISAGCHPIRPGESLRKLRFGAIKKPGENKYHVGFSSGYVKPLAEGEHYE